MLLLVLLLLLIAIFLVGVFMYWQLVIAEGVYLGPRVVSLLYDWAAHRYDAIKGFDVDEEASFLGAPLARALQTVSTPIVLDVACGSGRLALTLLQQPDFQGKIIGLDSSRAMLAQAARNLGERVPLVWQSAECLPFDDGVFDAVTCLEALEFMPSTPRALAEIKRVLRPGGLLLAANRIGLWASLMPGHTLSAAAFEQLLVGLGFEQVRTRVWQVEYNLVWAVRSGQGQARGGQVLADILLCPVCRRSLTRRGGWYCQGCAREYPLASDGVIEMLRTPAQR